MKGPKILVAAIIITGYGFYKYAKFNDAPIVYPHHKAEVAAQPNQHTALAPTIGDIARATLASDKCFGGINTPLQEYAEGGLEFYAQQRSSFDPQHPYVVLDRVNSEILDAENALRSDYYRLSDKDRQTFCLAAHEMAALWTSNKPEDFPQARPMPFLIPSAD